MQSTCISNTYSIKNQFIYTGCFTKDYLKLFNSKAMKIDRRKKQSGMFIGKTVKILYISFKLVRKVTEIWHQTHPYKEEVSEGSSFFILLIVFVVCDFSELFNLHIFNRFSSDCNDFLQKTVSPIFLAYFSDFQLSTVPPVGNISNFYAFSNKHTNCFILL